MDIVCEIKGCTNGGAMLDHDGVNKCQQHLVESAFTNRPIKVKKIGRNDACPCDSGEKYKKCCGNNSNWLRQWFLQHIGRKIYYKDTPKCDVPDCDDCKKWAAGVTIQNQTHARQLNEYALENKIQFTLIKPKP